MSSTPAAHSAVAAARHAIAAVRESLTAGGMDTTSVIMAAEELGRAVDAVRIQAAALIAHDPVAAERMGFASARDALAALARISQRTAQARLRIAVGVTENRTITGAPIPPAYPMIAGALDRGDLGIDAAELLTRELDSVRGRVAPEALGAAEALVVARAIGDPSDGSAATPIPAMPIPAMPISVEALSVEVRQITATIDPDGARPREERAVRRRAFRIGTQDADGLIPVSGRLLPEVGGLLASMIEAHRRSPRFRDASTDAPLDSPDVGDLTLDDAAHHDSRLPDQRRHDALAEIVAAASRSSDAPQLDGLPTTVIVTVSLADLASDGRDGDAIGTMAGSRFPLSRAQVLRAIDANGYRLVGLTATGAVAGISSVQRCFTAAQRLAIAARDGMRCATPGCTSPHYMLQAHHVRAARHGGPTHTINGILLCYWHHRRVDDGPWEYLMVKGRPYVRGPGVFEWTPLRGASARAA